MPKIEIVLPQKAVGQLQDVVDDFNAQTGQALTLEEWVALHLKETAIGKQLGAEAQTIKGDVDAEVHRRIAVRRRELLKALGEADAV